MFFLSQIRIFLFSCSKASSKQKWGSEGSVGAQCRDKGKGRERSLRGDIEELEKESQLYKELNEGLKHYIKDQRAKSGIEEEEGEWKENAQGGGAEDKDDKLEEGKKEGGGGGGGRPRLRDEVKNRRSKKGSRRKEEEEKQEEEGEKEEEEEEEKEKKEDELEP